MRIRAWLGPAGLLFISCTLPGVDGSVAAGAGAEARCTAGPADPLLAPCPGVRPGAKIDVDGLPCTMGWILTDGASFYGTTAGHCGAFGATVRLADHTPIGTVVYSRSRPVGQDLAVFRVVAFAEGMVDPRMCGWGGPTGLWEGAAEPGTVVRHYGHGFWGRLPAGHARSGVLSYANETTFAFLGAGAPGDSGSPARLDSGEAMGVITDLRAELVPGVEAGDPELVLVAPHQVGTRLDRAVAAVRATTGVDLRLVEAPASRAEPSAATIPGTPAG